MRARLRWLSLGLVGLGLAVVGTALLGPSYVGSNFDLPENWARITMTQISLAIVDYQDAHDAVPARLGDLLGTKGDSGTVLLDVLLDPWGRGYYYRPLPGVLQFELRSGGPDRTLWTGDDIVN